MKHYLFGCAFMLLLTGCFGGKLASSQGGEVTGSFYRTNSLWYDAR